MSLRRLWILLTSFILLAPTAFAWQPPAGQSEFVPVDSVPLSDQLPAAPLLVAAYAFVWIAVTVYLFSIWRRLNTVEDEMRALARKLPPR